MSNRAYEYANGDDGFAAWLSEVDSIVLQTAGISVFDLPDMLFRDSYDAGEPPLCFVREVVAEELGPFAELL
jgi:hypothetical protein